MDERAEIIGYWPGNRWKQARAVFDRSGLSPTLTAQMGEKWNNFVYVTEGERMNCKKVYDIPKSDLRTNESSRRVYSTDAISPSVTTICGGNQEPKILASWDSYNDKVDKEPDIAQAVQPRHQVPNHGERLVFETDCASTGINLLGGIGEMKSNKGTQWYLQDRIYDEAGLALAIPAESAFHPYYGGKDMEEEQKKRLRIRKLTEDECMRLMGFEEADTKAMRDAGLSKANIYHSAGDSIVTTVLVALLGSLIGADYETKIREWSDKLRKETL